MDGAEFQRKADVLFTTIRVGLMAHITWFSCREEKNYKKFGHVFQKYPLFFTSAFPALLYLPIIYGYKLFENRADTINFRQFRKESLESGLISQDLSDAVSNRIEGLLPTWERIKTARNKYLGHLDSELRVEEVFEKAGITPNMIRDYMFDCLDLLRTMYPPTLDRTQFLEHYNPESDTLELLSDLSKRDLE